MEIHREQIGLKSKTAEVHTTIELSFQNFIKGQSRNFTFLLSAARPSFKSSSATMMSSLDMWVWNLWNKVFRALEKRFFCPLALDSRAPGQTQESRVTCSSLGVVIMSGLQSFSRSAMLSLLRPILYLPPTLRSQLIAHQLPKPYIILNPPSFAHKLHCSPSMASATSFYDFKPLDSTFNHPPPVLLSFSPITNSPQRKRPTLPPHHPQRQSRPRRQHSLQMRLHPTIHRARIPLQIRHRRPAG